jgi:hypothetical protein
MATDPIAGFGCAGLAAAWLQSGIRLKASSLRARAWAGAGLESGDPAIRRSGDPAIRRSGDPAIRRSGDPDPPTPFAESTPRANSTISPPAV